VFALGASRPRSIVITASTHGDGATTTAINLAVVAAETGLRGLHVEADLRHPSAARYLGLRDVPGLVDAIADRGALADSVQRLSGQAVDVLAAGRPADPGELVGSPEMAELVATMLADYDFVVFDAAALLTSTDAAVLARHSFGVLVVVDTRQTKRRDLAAAAASLHRDGAPLLGVVLNKTAGGRHNRNSSRIQPGNPTPFDSARQPPRVHM
jgi:polysaccharide biosynthesis transport protein